MHEWGEEDFDWKALDDACNYLTRRCRQFARLGVWTKEKYGTMRVTAWFGLTHPTQSVVWPGYCRVMLPRWYIRWIDEPLGKLLRFFFIDKLIYKYQNMVLKYFWRRAAKKWPHIKNEILDEYYVY